MSRNRSKPLMIYIEDLLYTVIQEGVLQGNPDLTISHYGYNLVFADLQARNLLTPEILHSLITGTPLKVA